MAVNALTPDQIAAQKAQGVTPGQTIGTAAPAGQGPAGTPMAKQQASNLANQQQQGSGRFTNIQKYLGANQTGGQRIAGQVGQSLNKDLTQKSEQANKYYQDLGKNIAQANQVAQTGLGFKTQLQDIGNQIGQAQQAGFDARGQQDPTLAGIEAFTNQPNFNQFQNIQAGRGIDESLLALQQQRANQAAMAAAQGSQEAQQALGSEGGRYNLLRKTLGQNPGYTTGQQRLDQVLLGQGGGLGSVQAQVAQQARQAAQQAKLAGGAMSDVSRLTAQERGLIGDINTQASANEQAYVDMLQGFVDPLNAQRAAEFTNAEAKFKALQAQLNQPYNAPSTGLASGGTVTSQKLTPTSTQPLTPEQQFTSDELARLGVTGPTRAYNVFKGLTGFEDVATRGAAAQSAQDVANAQDVARYQALAKIRGLAPTEQKITQAADLGAAWAGKEGEANLGTRLADAQKAFDAQTALEKYAAGWSGAAPGGSGMQANVGSLVGTRGTGTELLDQGKQAIDVLRYGGKSPFEQQRINEVWNQFTDYLRSQGYQNTIGGEVAAPNQDVANIFNQGYTKT